MAEETAISWADSTANLWIGCQKVSAACDHCYAEDLMGTEGSRLHRVEWGPHGERQYCKQGWSDIRKWQRQAAQAGGLDPKLGRRRRVFVNSLSDFFDNHRSVVWRPEAWQLIRDCPHLIFMLVTKRPQQIGQMLPDFWDEIAERVWLITTVENQTEADRRVPALLASTHAHRSYPAVFGLSCEPLLGPVDLEQIELRPHGALPTELSRQLGDYIRPLTGNFRDSPKIGWVIVGGESGKHARPMHPAWAASLAGQCARAGVPFHFKQWGEWFPLTRLAMADDPPGTARRIGKVWLDGRTFEGDKIHHFPDNQPMVRAGKTTAGRMLGGAERLEMPDVG